MSERRSDDDQRPEPQTSSDERDLGWGERSWDRDGDTDADTERLLAERPPHHESRER